jgi:hypothetical protein
LLQLGAFLTAIIGEEDETALIEALEEHDPGGGHALGAHAGQRHRVGLLHLCLHRLVEPAGELGNRVRADIRLIQPGSGVLAT